MIKKENKYKNNICPTNNTERRENYYITISYY